jgi:YVTN family beta-propeller protein
MGFLCIKKNNKIVVSQTEIKETEFLRNIGLSNVYNLKPEINVCSEVFHSPEYYVSGTTTGLVTGLTATLTGCTTGATGIYNLTYTPDFNVNFIITGSTDFIDYTGNFSYKVFTDKNFFEKTTGGLVDGSELINKQIPFTDIIQTPPNNVTDIILLTHQPNCSALNTNTNKLYVASNNNISVIDCDTNTTTSFGIGAAVDGIVYNPLNNTMYLAVQGSNGVFVLDCDTNTTTTFIPVGSAPTFLTYSTLENKIYVSNISSNDVSVINCVTNTVIITISIGATVADLSYSPINNTVHVTNDVANTITVIDCFSDGIVALINTYTASTNRICYNTLNNKMYALSPTTDTVSIINCDTNSANDPTFGTGGIPIGTNAGTITYDSLSNVIYVGRGVSVTIDLINCYTNEVISNYITISAGATGFVNKSFNVTNNTLYSLLNGTSGHFKVAVSTASNIATITETFLEGQLPNTWGQYLIRPYYDFNSKDCNPGTYFNNWNTVPQLNSYQSNTDYYFMTIVDPPTPRLNPPGGIEKPNYTLVTDKLYVNGVSSVRGAQSINGDLNYFVLSSIPSSGILLVLNGVQLTENHDFRLIVQGFNVPPIVEVFNVIKNTDWLLATYIAGGSYPWTTNFGVYFMDTILVDTFTNTSTPSYRLPGDNSLNYNPVTLNYELFTSLPIDKYNSIILTVNGVKLADDAQYFKSTSFDGRIIFDKIYTSFNTGDIISVLAVSKDKGQYNNDYGSLKTNQFLVQWSVPPTFTNTDVTGRFIIEAFNDDTNALTNKKTVDFVDGQANYESLFTNLPLNVNYRFKVTFEATYYAYLNNEVITCSYSEGYFDTTNSYINNTY